MSTVMIETAFFFQFKCKSNISWEDSKQPNCTQLYFISTFQEASFHSFDVSRGNKAPIESLEGNPGLAD